MSSPEPDPAVLFAARTGSLNRDVLRKFALRLRRDVTKGASFCCLITGDEELRRMNRQFRKKDYPTDVLSFPSAGGEAGEVAISIDRAREQAREHGHGVTDEVRVLMLHGVLHLTGLDHERDGGRMERVETAWRQKLGLPAGLIERVSK
jgi:probable rRNA maturation factor